MELIKFPVETTCVPVDRERNISIVVYQRIIQSDGGFFQTGSTIGTFLFFYFFGQLYFEVDYAMEKFNLMPEQINQTTQLMFRRY